MPTSLASAVSLAAAAIITARDFCGDERAAAMQALRDAGVTPSPKALHMAQAKAMRIRQQCQYEGGVKYPLAGPGRRVHRGGR